MNLIFKWIRELQGITQKELASKLGITYGAIAQYENFLITLSYETLLKIADILSVKRDYVLDPGATKNPFIQSDKIFWFPLKGKNFKIDFSNIEHFADIMENSIGEIVILSRQKRLSENPIVAILMKDLQNNVYGFVHKKQWFFIGKLEDIKNKIESYFPNAYIRFGSISDDLSEKIYAQEFTKVNAEQFSNDFYSYACKRLAVKSPEGKIVYYPKVPISTVLRDWHKYMIHEEDIKIKKENLESFVSFYLAHIKKDFSDEKLEEERKIVFKAWNIES